MLLTLHQLADRVDYKGNSFQHIIASQPCIESVNFGIVA